ncbi:MAG: biopolymer transporter ExbD [Abditibacteriales bacterium]|nr:biopolymer transporter ExbD [Abditibacteriales bacterium]MDW8366587.1 biopolymer transporter ExbD [Abditibacteriales bacterium]
MHGRSHQPGEPLAEINVIPLVDIALVLLIIFMVTTVFVRRVGLNMQLPQTQVVEAEPEMAQDINIMLDNKAQVYLDGKEITIEALHAALKERAQQNTETRVIVKADRSIAYDHIVQVLDAVKMSGLHRVALATEPKSRVPSLKEVASHAPNNRR